ncbi:MAG: PaaI family thioesterase [Rhodospirillaceae bacterium]|nr:MAG: PaaI family thioesterase [Rhodospirillaceae bacterium]
MDSPTSSADERVPQGFVRMEPYGAFHELVGPLYEMRRGELTVVGLRVAAKHIAKGPGIHGGMYFMLLDTAMTHACVRVRRPDAYVVTTSFSSELFASARQDDWIEAEVEVMRAGGRVIFVNCIVRRDGPEGEALVRGSATFQIVNRTLPATGPAGDGTTTASKRDLPTSRARDRT